MVSYRSQRQDQSNTSKPIEPYAVRAWSVQFFGLIFFCSAKDLFLIIDQSLIGSWSQFDGNIGGLSWS